MRPAETVVIIGGGLSGLAAGALLARRGFAVRLFEANDKLGGSCATGDEPLCSAHQPKQAIPPNPAAVASFTAVLITVTPPANAKLHSP